MYQTIEENRTVPLSGWKNKSLQDKKLQIQDKIHARLSNAIFKSRLATVAISLKVFWVRNRPENYVVENIQWKIRPGAFACQQPALIDNIPPR
ncbi:hypothetical protein [Dickeya solani]|uniref:Uncharacterized protein n=1 Tax=Dickeya solani TaxID=1089444 RepID=A0ABU4EHH9_9GAMM|nr:hypothetical protein [Dickeya solani]ANE74362.1 hypothetical protein A4U42_02860 [Dickeya solani IPO 2222]AUC41596.1 hypothetical protein D083_1247 [Dickeya solani RNS 08.23.3.1.A]AUH10222.1 hypothetical protein BJD21_18175 [Dickeya solani D s0432-1]AUH14168.1 hypothetical protein BJJ98_18145 [Dickeya solani]MBJ2333666.1 hypothetical protein [Dickeya solani]